jgi:hypothetical protein
LAFLRQSFLQKGTAGSNDCSPANLFIITKIREIAAMKVAFPRQFREVKFGNATREKRWIPLSVHHSLPSPTMIFSPKGKVSGSKDCSTGD